MSLAEQVGVVAPGLTLDRRACLLAAARSRGTATSVDPELEAARKRLADLDVAVPSLAAARRRVASTSTDLEAKRERVATLRGRLQETDDESLADAYRVAIRELSEVETDHEAAREALANARERAQRARDERDQRLHLEDRIANLERRARGELVETVRPTVDVAVREAPGETASTYEAAGPVTAALAVLRVGRVRTPVVLACRRFEDAASATAWLEAPVCRH